VSGALRIRDPGLRSTLQDRGRTGWQRFGVPVSGALDQTALAAANLVAGNPSGMAAIELSPPGLAVEIEADAVRLTCAGRGATLLIERGGTADRIATLTSVTAVRGDRVRVVGLATAVGYLAVTGGFAVVPVLGSLSTYARAGQGSFGGLGGLGGRPLAAGDRLPLVLAAPPPGPESRGPPLDLGPSERLRVMPAADGGPFPADAIAAFLAASYSVSAAADRMGLRLDGESIRSRDADGALSVGIAPGAIQIPGDGRPILLLADRQTTGGYPSIAHVIAADLAAAGRLRPGDRVRFEAVDRAAAAAARRALAERLAAFASGIVRDGDRDAMEAALRNAPNLVSGVVSADE
jgi:biotin-dependent carboxylase-like uncharacterized protein